MGNFSIVGFLKKNRFNASRELTDSGITAIERAAELLTGSKKRWYIAELSQKFLNGNA